MKRTIAIILAMLMVFSMLPLVLAEDVVEEEPADDSSVVIISADEQTEEVDEEVEEEVETEEEEETEETEEEVVELPEEVEEEAGITPDSPLYGLERAMERISLALTFGKSAKAKKGLAHARERLMEVQAMIAAKKLDKAAKAQDELAERDSKNFGNKLC